MSASSRPGVQMANCTQTWLADWLCTFGVGHLATWSREVSGYLRSNQMAKLDTWFGRVDQIANCSEAPNRPRWPAVQVANLSCAGDAPLALLSTHAHSRAHCYRGGVPRASSVAGIRPNAGESQGIIGDRHQRVILLTVAWAGPR